MKILFVCRGNRTKTSVDILRALKATNPEYAGIALTIYEDKWFYSLDSIDKSLFDNYYGTESIFYNIGNKKDRINSSYYKEYGYESKEFWNYVFSERYIAELEHYARFTNPSYTREEIIVYSNLCLKKFEQIIEAESPDLILDFSPLGFMRGMLHLVASKYQIPYKIFLLSKIKGLSLFTDLYGHGIEEVRFEYEKLLAKGGCFKKADIIINKYRKKEKSLYSGHAAEKAESKLLINESIPKRIIKRVALLNLYFFSLWKDLYKEILIRYKARREPYFRYNYYLYISLPSKILVDKLLNRYKKWRFFLWQKKYIRSKAIDLYARQFLFTMHVQPEASTSVAAPFFCNQEFVLQNICRALPPDGVLLVKPHLSQVGIEALSLYKRLSKIHNLVFVSPKTSTKDLIKQCEAVITITGTVGLEALILGKQVVTFTDTLYSASKNVKVFKEFNNLKEYLYDGVISSADEADVKILVQAIINASVKADIFTLRDGLLTDGLCSYLDAINAAADKVNQYFKSMSSSEGSN